MSQELIAKWEKLFEADKEIFNIGRVSPSCIKIHKVVSSPHDSSPSSDYYYHLVLTYPEDSAKPRPLAGVKGYGYLFNVDWMNDYFVKKDTKFTRTLVLKRNRMLGIVEYCQKKYKSVKTGNKIFAIGFSAAITVLFGAGFEKVTGDKIPMGICAAMTGVMAYDLYR